MADEPLPLHPGVVTPTAKFFGRTMEEVVIGGLLFPALETLLLDPTVVTTELVVVCTPVLNSLVRVRTLVETTRGVSSFTPLTLEVLETTRCGAEDAGIS